MKININKEQLSTIGKAGLKVGKAIIIEGTKAVAVKSVTAIIMEGFDNGTEGIKKLSVDKLVSGGKVKEEKPKKEKGGLFKRKKKDEVEDAELAEIEEALDIIVNDINEAMAEKTKED